MDDFVIVYIDDILVYSKTVEEHAQHLEAVLGRLRDNKLYANGEKNDFAYQEIEQRNLQFGFSMIKKLAK